MTMKSPTLSMKNGMKQYNVILDLYKIAGCIIIMCYHSFLIGAVEPYFFQSGYLFTDLFFILTGYYTTKHLSGIIIKDIDGVKINKYHMAIIYLKNKFGKLMPYVVVSSLICSVITYRAYWHEGVIRWLWHFSNVPMETMLISQFYENYPLVNSLWYLSSLVFALPIFYIIFFKMDKYKEIIMAVLVFGLYEGVFVNYNFGSWGGNKSVKYNVWRSYVISNFIVLE